MDGNIDTVYRYAVIYSLIYGVRMHVNLFVLMTSQSALHTAE